MNGPSELLAKVIGDQDAANPKELFKRVNLELEDEGLELLSADEIAELIITARENESLHSKFYVQLGRWMTEKFIRPTADDESPTKPDSPERRYLIHRRLGLPEAADEELIAAYPDQVRRGAHLIESDEPWDLWYPRENQKTIYWDQYVKVLRDKNFDDDAIDNLDEATSKIVGRLADPTRNSSYQSKGLVVGYVQSGKTANFAGTIAKAIDAGYKLIIVLTGTIELLRAQTQKRLDKELVGEENVLGGAGPKIAELQSRLDAMSDDNLELREARQALIEQINSWSEGVDYVELEDQDWKEGKFARFGLPPRQLGAPSIIRVTSLKDDYKALKTMLQVIDFDRTKDVWSKPIYDTANINTGDVWLAVVKKNSSTLKKLRADLEKMQTRLSDIPALIIDDEADQASVNTKRRKQSGTQDKDTRERTAINKHVAGMLETMPRSQYLAYTATPYANVFVDPVDSVDIFPKDFIAALEPSTEYMGAKSFHDIGERVEDGTMSNRDAYYRPVGVDEVGMAQQEGISAALNAYVLSGAIKLWRRTILDNPASLKHHTMMVHEGANTSQHEDSRAQVVAAWNRANFTSPRGVARLKELWERDFSRVSAERAADAPIPESFESIKPFIGRTVQLVNSSRQNDGEANPVVVVNGTKESEYAQPDINFDKEDGVWKILVGGTKLSRGFTVEGLTVTLYTRVTVAADTLMQMGRWFGYRKYYRDLVRLYLGEGIVRKHGAVDLYESFSSIAQDEEDFRSELVRYAEAAEDGRPLVTPMDVAPLVTQRLPWLKPSSPNKMYNAVIVEQGMGGKLSDLFAMKSRGEGGNTTNIRALSQLLPGLVHKGEFGAERQNTYGVNYGVVDAQEVVDFLDSMVFFDDEIYKPRIDFIRSRIGRSSDRIDDFVVYIPSTFSGITESRSISGLSGQEWPVIKRSRRSGRNDFSGSAPRHRMAAEAIAGERGRVESGIGGPLVEQLRNEGKGRRGALMINLAADHSANEKSDPVALPNPADPEDIVTLVSLAVPYRSAPKGVLQRKVIVPGKAHQPVVDRDEK